MSENLPEPCDDCFNPFPRYAAVCPACKATRWLKLFEYVEPDPVTGEFPDNNRKGIAAKDLNVVPADPNGNGLVLLHYWGDCEHLCGGNLVKPIGFFWYHASGVEAYPENNFPPLSPDEARNKFFYEEGRKPKGEKLADSDILARARCLHGKGSSQEWNCDFGTNYMRQLRDEYPLKRGLPEIKKRPYTRK